MHRQNNRPLEPEPLTGVPASRLPASGIDDPAQSPEAAVLVFNPEDLLGSLAGDRPLAEIILKGFLGDAPSQLDTLRVRLDESDALGARLRAHTLKGAAATVAAGSLYRIALDLERAATKDELDRCLELLPCAVDELDRFRSTLERSGWV